MKKIATYGLNLLSPKPALLYHKTKKIMQIREKK